MSQRTLVLLKPDTVRRGLIGDVLSRFEAKGRMSRHLAAMPVYLIVHEDPAFIGLRWLARQRLRDL